MRKGFPLSMVLILIMACTCQVPAFLGDLLPPGGEARGEMIDYDVVVDGIIGSDGREYWSFSGRSGDQITISMDSSDFDTFLTLFGPDDNYLTADDDSGGSLNAMIRRFVLPSSGIHNIVAMSYGGDVGGDYTLELQRTDTGREPDEIGGGTIEIGDTLTQDLQTWTGDVWLFSGQEGDRVTISMQSDEFDTVLEIWGPDLMRAEHDDDGGDRTDSLIEGFRLPASGTYSIVARGFSIGETGSYRLSLD